MKNKKTKPNPTTLKDFHVMCQNVKHLRSSMSRTSNNNDVPQDTFRF